MTDDSTKPARFENSPHPTAFVHEGFFVYANPAFLQRLGYQDLEELSAIPLLDLVEDQDHEKLREHLGAAKKAAGTDQHQPRAKLALRRADHGTHLFPHPPWW